MRLDETDSSFIKGGEADMTRKTYVCKRLRLCNYLRERGFEPYSVAPDHNDPRYNVFLFAATPELNAAVIDYVNSIPHHSKI